MNYGYIYKTTNALDNKIYIGKRKGEFKQAYFGSGLYINNAINKYGKDHFVLEVIVYAEDKEKLNELEKQYIKEYRDKFGRDNLYNIGDGGEGGNHNIPHSKEARERIKINHADVSGENNPMFGSLGGFYGKHHSEKTKIKMCKPKSAEHCKHISENHVGMLGKHHSEETKRKMSLSR